MPEVDNLFSEMKDAPPIPCSSLLHLIINHTVILAFKPVSGSQLPFSNGEDAAMVESTGHELGFLLQTLHLVPLACPLTALTH